MEDNTTGRTEVGAGEETVGPCGIASPVNALISLIQVQVALPILEPSLLGVFDSTSRHITLDRKRAGKPIAGNRHDGFEVAGGAGNQLTVWLVRHSQRKRGATDRLNLRSMAPVLDTTRGGQTINFIATDIYRVADGRIAENWHIEDNLTHPQQEVGLISK